MTAARHGTAAPDPGELVALGRVVKPHGLAGELLVFPYESRPEPWEAARRARLHIRSGDRLRPYASVRLESFRWHGTLLLVKLAGVSDRTAAERIGKTDILICRDDLPDLEVDEFYACDLEGLEVVDRQSARALGRIEAVNSELGQAQLVVRGADGNAFLVPFVAAFVDEIDLKAGAVKVSLPAGLVDVNLPAKEKEEENE